MERLKEKQIIQYIKKARTRIFTHRLIHLGAKGVTLGALFALVLQLVAFIIPFYYVNVASICSIAIGFVAFVLYGMVTRLSMKQAALICDSKGLKERVITAYENIDKTDHISLAQRNDALATIKKTPLKTILPFQMDKQKLLFLLGSVCLVTILAFVPTKTKDYAEKEHKQKVVAQKEIKKLKDAKKELEKISDKDKETKKVLADVKEALKETKKELKEAKNKEDVKKATKRLSYKMDQAIEKTKNKDVAKALNDIKNVLDNSSSKEKEKLIEMAKKAEELKDKLNNELSDKEKKELSEEMKDLAKALDDEELAKLAQQLGENTLSQEEMEQLQASLGEASQQLANQAQEAGSMSSSSGSQMASAEGNEGSVGMGNGSGQSGNSGAQGNGQGAGAGQGQGQGGGMGNNNGAGQGGTGWNYGSNQGKEDDSSAGTNGDMVTIPNKQSNDNLKGNKNNTGSSYQTQSNSGLSWTGNKVSFGTVYSQYKNNAYKKVSSSYYPASMQDLVKIYFEGLNQ